MVHTLTCPKHHLRHHSMFSSSSLFFFCRVCVCVCVCDFFDAVWRGDYEARGRLAGRNRAIMADKLGHWEENRLTKLWLCRLDSSWTPWLVSYPRSCRFGECCGIGWRRMMTLRTRVSAENELSVSTAHLKLPTLLPHQLRASRLWEKTTSPDSLSSETNAIQLSTFIIINSLTPPPPHRHRFPPRPRRVPPHRHPPPLTPLGRRLRPSLFDPLWNCSRLLLLARGML